MKKQYYNPQTNVFDYLKKKRRSWDWYDSIWKTVGKCVFCDLKDRYVIFEKNGIVLTANLFPYADAHLLIVPRRHIEYFKEFTKEEWEALRGVMYVAKKVLRKVFKKKNVWFLYREGALGQAQKTVGHLHIQVVPYVEKLFTINYQPISWAPGEVGDRMKEEDSYMEKKFEKYMTKYGKYSGIERRIIVSGVVKNKNGEILLVKKKHALYQGWETPAGNVDKEESLVQASKREVFEETNIKIKNVKFVGIDEEEQEVVFPEGFTRKWRMVFIHYRGEVKGRYRVKAGDDVKLTRWVNKNSLRRYKLSKVTTRLFKKMRFI